MKLSQITNRKFIETYDCTNKFIDTPSGKVKILQVHKTIPYLKYKIVLQNGMFLEGAYNHVVMDINNKEYYIKDCKNQILQTVNGPSKVVEAINLKIEENMYDLSLDSKEEVYFSNGILSHNSGKSVTVGIYLSHTFLFEQDKNIGIAANKAGMAREFVDKVKKILIELPMWLQPGFTAWNKSYIEAENGMRILSDATSADSFRGFTISILVVDECVEYNETITVRNDKTGEIETIKIGNFYNKFL